MPGVNVIVVAGGRGRRFGGEEPKQFLSLAGEPMLRRSVRCFGGVPDLAAVVVVASPDAFARCEALLRPLGLPLRFAACGPERQDSVAAGVAALDPDCEIAVVHDAARPLVTPDRIADCIAAARAHGAAILATPVADTIKRGRDGRVTETVARSDLWVVQTPQAFRADVLRRAHAAAGGAAEPATDDAALVERLGLPVAIVPGDPSNRKITTPDDLAWAEALLAARGASGR
jgi:2-C-methyl-D-erythritol 4-phosphate cytidylyltransferase